MREGCVNTIVAHPSKFIYEQKGLALFIHFLLILVS